VEQLQEISEEDAIAEGFEGEFNGVPISGLQHAYAADWDSRHRKHKWAANPWVAAYGLERVK
jgi:hypothetical protein